MCGAFGIPSSMPPMLQGAVAGPKSGNTVVPVNYNSFGLFLNTIQAGAQMLDAALRAGTGRMIVFGHSAGAVCANYWLANYVSGPIATTSISPANLSFIFIGNSVHPYGGALGAETGAMIQNWFGTGPTGPPQGGIAVPSTTPFTVTDCIRQYDGWADWPTGSGLGLVNAEFNALAGQNSVHPAYQNVSLTDPTAVTYVVGNITYLWWQTTPLPILGTTWNSWVSSLDYESRPTIESAYSRPVTVPSPFSAHPRLSGRGVLRSH
jgi:hypothetical protein